MTGYMKYRVYAITGVTQIPGLAKVARYASHRIVWPEHGDSRHISYHGSDFHITSSQCVNQMVTYKSCRARNEHHLPWESIRHHRAGRSSGKELGD
ncbi:MAG: hypothetical protein V3V96_14900 [Acidiferrobacterales bacterium]